MPSEYSFESLVLPLRGRLLAFAFKLTRNRVRAEDVVQESLLRAWRFWNGFISHEPEDVEDTSSARTLGWMYRIVSNTFVNEYNQTARRAAVLQAYRDEMSSPDAQSTITALPEPLSEEVTNALAELPAAFRQTFELHYLKDMTVVQISDACGIPTGTVLSRLHRARKLLEKSLGAYAAAEYGLRGAREDGSIQSTNNLKPDPAGVDRVVIVRAKRPLVAQAALDDRAAR